jgi:hypothetical protein
MFAICALGLSFKIHLKLYFFDLQIEFSWFRVIRRKFFFRIFFKYVKKGVIPTTGSPTVTLLRLHFSHSIHTYDENLQTFYRYIYKILKEIFIASNKFNSQNVTGGVYKARVHFHRSMLIYDY